ncbi:MAG: hypothetical protein MSH11_06175 [Ruminococcus sp.]|nr:hypothetical protein [Ruminococcus sp.]
MISKGNDFMVDTAELVSLANEMNIVYNKVIVSLEKIDKIISCSNLYWNGESAELFRNFYREDTSELERIKFLTQEQIEKLQKIIEQYEGEEKSGIMSDTKKEFWTNGA